MPDIFEFDYCIVQKNNLDMTAPISKSMNKSGLSGASAEIEISNMEYEYFGWYPNLNVNYIFYDIDIPKNLHNKINNKL